MKRKALAVVGCMAILCGCALFTSWDDVTNTWIGSPIARLQAAHGSPSKVTPLPDGQSEYRYDLKKLDPSCVQYWVINAEGIIVGQRHTGYCSPV